MYTKKYKKYVLQNVTQKHCQCLKHFCIQSKHIYYTKHLTGLNSITTSISNTTLHLNWNYH